MTISRIGKAMTSSSGAKPRRVDLREVRIARILCTPMLYDDVRTPTDWKSVVQRDPIKPSTGERKPSGSPARSLKNGIIPRFAPEKKPLRIHLAAWPPISIFPD